MRPVTFSGSFGWLHEAERGALGVVMCASWEYEAAAIGQSWRVFADRLAAAGVPALRFDYPGCGDSLGGSENFESALASIRAATATLREQTGVARVALVGLRLGASLALMAAETLDVEAVALIRPVTRGKGFVSEQRVLGRFLQAKEPQAVRRDPDPGAIEVEGFRLSPESVERIGKIDLTTWRGAGLKRALIAGEHGSTQYDALAATLEARGVEVSRTELVEVAGWAPAPVPLPPPLADADALAAWLRVDGSAKGAVAQGEATLADEGFRERAFAFGPADELAGVLCEPLRPSDDPKRRAVLFLNTGANSHIGAGRATVHHARQLAQAGVASLRLDSKGVGDAAWTSEGPLSAIHHAERTSDVTAAIDWLEGRGFRSFALVGVCSGGFLAFQGALADPRIDRVLIANPQFWLPPSAETLADPYQGAYSATADYAARATNRETWKRLLKGDLKLASIVRVGRELALRAGRKAMSALGGRANETGELIGLLKQLKARRCAATLVLSEGDPARETLAALLPRGDFAALDGLLTVVTVEGADHAFIRPRTRAEFFALLGGFLGLGRERAERRAAA